MELGHIDGSKIIADLVQNNLDKILIGIHKFGKDQIAELSVISQRAFIEYLERSQERYGKVKTLLHKSTPVDIYDFYVPNNLLHDEGVIQTDSIKNVLNISNCCMILGSGGTGKSTLFKHLFLNSMISDEKIPIFVLLRNINGTHLSLIDCIYETLSTFGFSLEKEYFIESLDKGIYTFFFDGFDEVEENQQKRIIREISNMTNKYNKNNYLVSSRVLDSISMGWEEFTDFVMQPFNKNQALELLEKLPYDVDVKFGFIKKLEKSLYDDHKSFCSNPLLLTLMLMTYDEFADIPDKIHVFYSQAYEVLYSKHDATKPGFTRVKKTDKDNIGSDGFTKVLEVISAASYFDNKNSYTGRELSDYITTAKKVERLDFNSEDYKSDLVQAVCILILDGLKYTYQHRTFQEYFTAKYINRQSEERQKKMLLRLLTEKGVSLNSDQVLNILMDLNRTMVEKLLIIPLLQELRETIKDNNKEDSYIKFFNNYFPYLRFRFIKNSNFIRINSIFSNAGNSNKVMALMSFVEKKYANNFKYSLLTEDPGKLKQEKWKNICEDDTQLLNKMIPFAKSDKEIERLNNAIERMNNSKGKNTSMPLQGMWGVHTKNILGDLSLREEIFEIAQIPLTRLDYCLNLLKRLEKEHEEIISVEDSFF